MILFLVLLVQCVFCEEVPVIYLADRAGVLVGRVEDGLLPSPSPLINEPPFGDTDSLKLPLDATFRKVPLRSLSSPNFNMSVPSTGVGGPRGISAFTRLVVLPNGALVGTGVHRRADTAVRVVASLNPPDVPANRPVSRTSFHFGWGAADDESMVPVDPIDGLLLKEPEALVESDLVPGGSLLGIAAGQRDLIDEDESRSIVVSDWSAVLWTANHLYVSPAIHANDQSASHDTITRMPMSVSETPGAAPLIDGEAETIVLATLPAPDTPDTFTPGIRAMVEHPTLGPDMLVVVTEQGTVHARNVSGSVIGAIDYVLGTFDAEAIDVVTLPNSTRIYVLVRIGTNILRVLGLEGDGSGTWFSSTVASGATALHASPLLNNTLFLLYPAFTATGYRTPESTRILRLVIDDGPSIKLSTLFEGAINAPYTMVATMLTVTEIEQTRPLWPDGGDVVCGCDVRNLSSPKYGADTRVDVPVGWDMNEDIVTFGLSMMSVSPDDPSPVGSGMVGVPGQYLRVSACENQGFGCRCNLPSQSNQLAVTFAGVAAQPAPSVAQPAGSCYRDFIVPDVGITTDYGVTQAVEVALRIRGDFQWSAPFFFLVPDEREEWCSPDDCAVGSCVAPGVCYCYDDPPQFNSFCEPGVDTPTVDIYPNSPGVTPGPVGTAPPGPDGAGPPVDDVVTSSDEVSSTAGGVGFGAVAVVIPLLCFVASCLGVIVMVFVQSNRRSGSAPGSVAAAELAPGNYQSRQAASHADFPGFNPVAPTGTITGQVSASRTSAVASSTSVAAVRQTSERRSRSASLKSSSGTGRTRKSRVGTSRGDDYGGDDDSLPSYDDLMGGGSGSKSYQLALEDD
jgi:hypothetical protein